MLLENVMIIKGKIKKLIALISFFDLLVFSSFPLIGYFFSYKKIFPLNLFFASFFIAFAGSIENRVEGYKINPKDSQRGNLLIFLSSNHLFYLKLFYLSLYFSGALLTFIFSKNSLPWVLLSILFAILYNNNKINPKKRPPLDSILHLIGSFSFTIAGCLWEGRSLKEVFPLGIALSFLFTGGYWNHLYLDKKRDEEIGIKTMAHKLNPKILRAGTIVFLSIGDLFFVFLLYKELRVLSLIAGIVFLATLFSGLIIKNPKKYRKIYRTIHSFLLLIIFFYFTGFLKF